MRTCQTASDTLQAGRQAGRQRGSLINPPVAAIPAPLRSLYCSDLPIKTVAGQIRGEQEEEKKSDSLISEGKGVPIAWYKSWRELYINFYILRRYFHVDTYG